MDKPQILQFLAKKTTKIGRVLVFVGAFNGAAMRGENAPVEPTPAEVSLNEWVGLMSERCQIGAFYAQLRKAVGGELKPIARAALPVKPEERVQIAALLGVLLADGFYAAELANAQEVKNVFRDLRDFATYLGVNEEVLARNKQLTELVEAGKWEEGKGLLVQTLFSLCEDLKKQRDEALVVFLQVGLWFRAIQIAAAVTESANASQQEAALSQEHILQKAQLMGILIHKIDSLPDKVPHSNLARSLRDAAVLLQAEMEGVMTETTRLRILEIAVSAVTQICGRNFAEKQPESIF